MASLPLKEIFLAIRCLIKTPFELCAAIDESLGEDYLEPVFWHRHGRQLNENRDQ
jgi:hypothetical protein